MVTTLIAPVQSPPPAPLARRPHPRGIGGGPRYVKRTSRAGRSSPGLPLRPLENWSHPAYTEDFAVLTDAVKRVGPDLVL